MNDVDAALAVLPEEFKDAPAVEARPYVLPALGSLDSLELPGAAIPEAAEPQDAAAVPAPSYDPSNELADLTRLALNKTREILNLKIDQKDENYATTVRVSLAAATSILNTTTKVDEMRLRQRAIDKLPELLDIIAAEERLLPAHRQPVELLPPEGVD